jgi:hypothetical protein
MDPSTNQHTDDTPTNEDMVYFNWRKAGWVCALAPGGCPACAADAARKRALAARKRAVGAS